jgi:PII-like signaling protein
MLDTELRMKLQFFFAEVCLCFEKSFYMPLIQLLQSENLASNEILRGIIFLMEIMGDAHFWFGISGEVPFYTEVVHRENNVANTIFPRSDKSKQGKIVGSNSSSAASIASARIQCALHYIDLLVLVIVGKDLLRPCHTGQRIQFTLGHVAVVMEFIWMIRRLRKSSKSVGAKKLLQK